METAKTERKQIKCYEKDEQVVLLMHFFMFLLHFLNTKFQKKRKLLKLKLQVAQSFGREYIQRTETKFFLTLYVYREMVLTWKSIFIRKYLLWVDSKALEMEKWKEEQEIKQSKILDFHTETLKKISWNLFN